jgi:lipid-A-disaccharide synthase
MSETQLSPQPIRIGIVAGEPSGDILAAGLLQHIKARHPDAIIEGIGGPLMQAQGCRSLFDMEELSVMGLIEVLSRIKRLLYVRKTILQHFSDNPPDVFIGVDAPDFNLKLEKLLKRQGIKTVHYVSPTVWAWREKRIFSIAESTNLVLSIFPFEKTLYDKYDIPCEFVGHTMADEIPMEPDRQQARSALSISSESNVLALLPGSRGSEVRTLLSIFMQSAELLKDSIDNLLVLIPAVNLLRKQQIERYLHEHPSVLNVRVLVGRSREAMIASNAILLASGTATLEAMLCKRPMVAAYQLKWLTYQMMKRLYLAKYFTLPNLLADEPIIPELLQEQANPQNIASLLSSLISGEKTQDMQKFAEIHTQLKQNANDKAADAVLNLIHGK